MGYPTQKQAPARRDGTRHCNERLAKLASAAVAADVDSGSARYVRERILPRLIAAGPDDLNAAGATANAHIMRMLQRALRRERALGRAGHWTYDLNRHIGLAQAYAAERARSAAKTLAHP